MSSQQRIKPCNVPYARDINTLLNRSLFLDELAQDKDIEEVSLSLAEVLYAFLQSEISKSGPKN